MKTPCAPPRTDLPPQSEGINIDLEHSIDGTLVFNTLCEMPGKPKAFARGMKICAFPELQLVILTHGPACACSGKGETALTFEQILNNELKSAAQRGHWDRPQKGKVICPPSEEA